MKTNHHERHPRRHATEVLREQEARQEVRDIDLTDEEPVLLPPPSYYYPLFNHMAVEHGLVLLDSQMDEIARIVRAL